MVSFRVHSPSSGVTKTIYLDLSPTDQLRPSAERALKIAKKDAGIPSSLATYLYDTPETFAAMEKYDGVPIFRYDDFIRGMEVNRVHQSDDFNDWNKDDMVVVWLGSTETLEYKMGEIQRQEEIIVEQGDRIGELERIIEEQEDKINELEDELVLLQQQNETLEKEKSILNERLKSYESTYGSSYAAGMVNYYDNDSYQSGVQRMYGGKRRKKTKQKKSKGRRKKKKSSK